MYQTYPVGLPAKQEQSQSAPAAVNPNNPSDPLIFFLMTLADSEGNETTLSIENGDLIATAIKGPNAGKSCNLTYGRWM